MIRELILCLLLNNWIHLISASLDDSLNEELKHQPRDHVIPYSEHENPPEPPTKPEYIRPGQWVGPLSDKNSKLEFVPTRLYAQVRHSDSVKRVPRDEALKAAETNEERENIGRLREVVKKQKVNTYYTEEGYEDAAYDHAGHIRDADYDEKYNRGQETKIGDAPENDHPHRPQYHKRKVINDDDNNNSEYEESDDSKKLNSFTPYKGFYQVWEESGINPQSFAKSGTRQLERNIEEKNKEASKAAETKVPENLKNLADSTESGEASSYQYESSTTFADKGNNTENSISDSTESEKNNGFRIVAADRPDERNTEKFSYSPESFEVSLDYNNKSSVLSKEAEEFEKDVAKVDSLVARLLARNAMPIYNYDDLSTEWSNKIYTSTSNFQDSPELTTPVYNSSSNPEYSSSKYQLTTYRKPPLINVPENRYRYSPQVYESWKRKGIEEKYEESTPELRKNYRNSLITSNEEYSTEKVTAESNEVEASDKLKKKYVLMVRNNMMPRNESKLQKLRLNKPNKNLLRFNDNDFAKTQSSIIPIRGYQTSSYDNSANQQNMNLESGSVDQENQAVENTPSSVHLYRYQKQPYYRLHHGTRRNLKKRILPLITMLPPSPISRSEYAHYYTDERRNGGSRPQYKLRPAVPKYKSAFRNNRKTHGKWRRNFAKDNKKRNYEKVPLKGVNISHYQMTESISDGLRQKRDTQEQRLLYNAPKVVEDVIEKELAERFPETEEKNKSVLSGEKLDDEDSGEKKVEVEVPDFDFSNEVKEIVSNKNVKKNFRKGKTFNHQKYPFYNNNQIYRASSLKYITNPLQAPQKTSGGSEFYDSRDSYLECPEVDPDLTEVVPEEESPHPDRGPKSDLPRLRGLGDKITCLRTKYFDENPLDNPLFAERKIESPAIPEELNLKIFKSRNPSLDSEPGENVYRRVSRKPEIIDIRPIDSRLNEISNNEPNRSRYHYAEPPVNWINHAKQYRTRSHTTTAFPFIPYQKLVYEDVMGTINNLNTMLRTGSTTFRPKLGLSRYRKVKKTHTRNQEKKDDKIYFTTQSPDSSETGQSLESHKNRKKKLKIYPYRTNKVTYRMRPMARPYRGVSNKTISYLKTVRVHKREISNDDLKVEESRTSTKRDSDFWKNFKSPITTTTPSTSDELGADTKKLVYTLIDRAKNMKPRVIDGRHGDYTTQKPTIIMSTTTKRNEETYNPVRKFDGDIKKIGYIDKGQEIENLNERYDVVEVVQENQNNNPVTIKKYVKEDNIKNEDTRDDEEDNTEVDEYTDAIDDHKKFEMVYENTGDENGNQEQIENLEYEDHDDNDNQDHGHDYSHESNEMEDDDKKYHDADDSGDHYHDEEKNFFTESEHEKDFERFSSRPLSHYENYEDSKYSALGPRLYKPAFHHPSFDSIRSKKLRENHDRNNNDSNRARPEKHLFPWHEDDKDATVESRKFEEHAGHHEFPWERRKRLNKLKKKIDDYHPSESLRHSSIADHWHSHFKFGDHSFLEEDSHPFSSDSSQFTVKPTKSTTESIEMLMRQAQDSLERMYQPKSIEHVTPVQNEYKSKKIDENEGSVEESQARKYDNRESQDNDSKIKEYQSKEDIQETAEDQREREYEEKQTTSEDKIAQNATSTGTTTTPQIPAPSAENPSARSKSTTPTVPIMNQRLIYTVKSRPKRLGVTAGIAKNKKNLSRDKKKLESEVQTSSIPMISAIRTAKRRGRVKKKHIQHSGVNNNNGNYNYNKDNNNNDNNKNNNNTKRRRFTMTSSSTTTPSSHRRKLYNSLDNKSTTPASRKIEHRSKVSKEEIITRRSFPSIEVKMNKDSIGDNTNPPEEMIQKVSIVTKETPEHIYQTQEINQNGKKNMYVVIIPNNNTDSLHSYENSKPNQYINMPIIDKFEVEDIENSKNPYYNEESPVLDVSLPAADKLKFSEHGSKQIMSAVSYISQNYDF